MVLSGSLFLKLFAIIANKKTKIGIRIKTYLDITFSYSMLRRKC